MTTARALVLSVLASAATAAALAVPATAAEFAVTSTADGAGSCAPGSQTCTVRQALLDAKGVPGRDVVRVPPGTYDLTGQDLIVGIGDAVDVIGADPATTVLREVSGGDGRVFLVEQDASLHLRGLTLTGSRGVPAVLLFGGGNELRATDVTFAGNTAARGAGVDVTAGGTALLDAVTLHANVASDRGGAVRVAGAGASVTLSRSTVTENAAPVGAGVAVGAGGAATLAQSTVVGGQGVGADIDVAAGATTTVRATVLGACGGPVAPASLGHNLAVTASCGLGGPGDRAGLDPLLGPLASVVPGTGTPVRAPQPGSPLVDADPACAPGAVDQRGLARPQGPACDIGAVEVAVPPVVTPPPAPPAPPASPVGPGAGTSPPRVERLSLSPTRFRPGTARGRGTRVAIRLDRSGLLRLRVERARPGRRRGGRCVAPGRARVTASRRCTRWVLLRGVIERPAPRGASSLRFSGRIGGRTLAAGRHRLVVRTRSAPGAPQGPVRRVTFRVVR